MRRIGTLARCLVAVLGLTAAHRANAGPVDSLNQYSDLLSQFNVITFGDFTTTADVEGRAVIGGNMTGGATFANNSARPPNGTSSYPELTVYGNETGGGNYNIDAGGVTILGSNAGNFTANNGGNVFVGGNNTGKLTTTNGSVSVLGTNNALLSASGGKSVYVGATNSGELDANGSGSTVGINGNNTGTLTLNDGGTVQINGNTSGDVNLSSGSLTAAGSISGNQNGGGTRTPNTAVSLTPPSVSLPDFNATFTTPLTQLSTQLAALTPTAPAPTPSGNTLILAATPGAGGQAVLDISSALFAANTVIEVDMGSAGSMIINVTIPGCAGTNCTLTVPSSVHFQDISGAEPTVDAAYLLWNFVNATSLNFQTEIGGTILSPYATVTNSSPIDGTLVAAAYNGTGELHSFPFVGSLPSVTSGQGSTPVPEPSTLVVLLSGLVGVGLLRRRRARV